MSHPSGELDVLIAAAVKGDRRALGKVLGVVQPFVTRYCRARLGSQNRSYRWADDVAQEVCLAVITALPGYCNQNRSFLAFLYGIAVQEVLDTRQPKWRGRSYPVSAVPDTEKAAPEQQPTDSAPSTQMGQMLEVLQPKHREVLLLRMVLGLSAEQTAEAMESTPTAVRVAQHRALVQLRSLLSPGGVGLSA
ncbi:MAG: RNA polymerase sigma factor ShbA [Pseudonocardiaceae bacterium]